MSVAVFAIDYRTHVLLSERRIKYALSFWGLVDLLSILPSYLMLLKLTALRGTKALRLIRVARVLRVLKLVRVAVEDSDVRKNPIVANLNIYFILFFLVLMISSTSMCFVEGSLYSPGAIEAGQKLVQAATPAGQAAANFMPVDPIRGNPIPEDKRFFTSIPAAMGWSVVTMTSTG